MLVLAALAWVGLHLGIAGSPLRPVIARRIGEQGFRAAFSVASAALLAALVLAYIAAPTTILWTTPPWLKALLAAAMLPAFLLFVGAVSQSNATSVGGERAAAAPIAGVMRITRDPMLWAFAIWAAVHITGNGDTAAVIFFGAFLVTALAGMRSIDRKLARRGEPDWRRLAATTSILPFVAIAQGRNKFVPAEYGWLRLGIGIIAWSALLHWHPALFGVSALG